MHRYQEFAPDPRLARYVECYWSRQDSDGTAGHRVLPDGCVDILLTTLRGEPLGLEIVGLMTAPKIFDVEPGQAFFGVRFRPGMAAEFVPEAARLLDRNEPLENVLSAGGRHLLDQLAESPGPAEMARVMDHFLRPLEPPDAAQKALHHLALTRVSLDSLAAETGLSARHLRRLCVDRAGVSPKYLIRILRFREAAERIHAIAACRVQSADLADLAIACGYYDQAHFIRDFQEFTGHTPGRYLQSLVPVR